jgi:hypothetical protein
MLRCGIEEDNEALMAWFIGGLNKEIQTIHRRVKLTLLSLATSRPRDDAPYSSNFPSPFYPLFPRSNRLPQVKIAHRKTPSIAANSSHCRRLREQEALVPSPFSSPLLCASSQTISSSSLSAFRQIKVDRTCRRLEIPPSVSRRRRRQRPDSSTKRATSLSLSAPRRPLHHLREHLQRRRRLF